MASRASMSSLVSAISSSVGWKPSLLPSAVCNLSRKRAKFARTKLEQLRMAETGWRSSWDVTSMRSSAKKNSYETMFTPLPWIRAYLERFGVRLLPCVFLRPPQRDVVPLLLVLERVEDLQLPVSVDRRRQSTLQACRELHGRKALRKAQTWTMTDLRVPLSAKRGSKLPLANRPFLNPT